MKKTNLKIISALVVVLVCAIFAFDYFGNEAEDEAKAYKKYRVRNLVGSDIDEGG